MTSINQLHYGDNLDVLREKVADSSVDLVYLDPPFNSNRKFNVLFSRGTYTDEAQIQAFDDTWHWTPQTEEQFDDFINGGLPLDVADALGAFRMLLGENDMLAYLVNMAPRLVELRRVLKPTGSLYLHCDPTASHYLKIVLDAIFDARYFRNEIIWKRFSAKNDPKRFGRNHDVILFYTKGPKFTWNAQYGPFEDDYVAENYRYVDPRSGRRYRRGDLTAAKPGGDVDYEWHGARPYKGRHWAYSREKMDQMLAEGRIEFRSTGMPVFRRYLDEQPGVALQDLWTDIRLTSGSKERLGYPTQKPVALLERIIQASSNPGDIVLDPFCGCGTAIDAATRLKRRWIGIDITYIAVDLIRNRLIDRFGPSVAETYEISGIPRDRLGAAALWERSPLDFERWAVSLVGGTPNEKQVGDKGVDGVIRFHHTQGRGAPDGRIAVSVKGGHQLTPSMVQALDGALNTHHAQMGLMVTLHRPTKGMRDIANRAGTYRWPMNGETFPRLQILTVAELLAGAKLRTPSRLLPYISAIRHVDDGRQGSFDDPEAMSATVDGSASTSQPEAG
ncbi:MAG TPA: DNA methyltransferase [Frankiaceae bacterium]|jgi:DNA modification methylase|nr:DNA methyltransferase [Frankiaceae bacterium]